MLIDFSCANYRSFYSEQSFTMRCDHDNAMSPTAAICGVNAAGKTNLLKAIHAMHAMVVSSYAKGGPDTGVNRDPFRLCDDPSVDETMFRMRFTVDDGTPYEYEFRCDDRTITFERLSYHRLIDGHASTHATRLFERTDTSVTFGTAFKGPRMQMKQIVGLRPNALMLSIARAAGVETVRPAADFLANRIGYCSGDLFTFERPHIIDRFEHADDHAVDEFNMLIERIGLGVNGLIVVPDERGGTGRRILVSHTGRANTIFPLEDESRGTLKAIALLSLFLRRLSHPTVTLVDDIDANLHPTLLREFIDLYADPETNPYGSQLIFTAHDATLTDAAAPESRTVATDQTWFVEKNRDGESVLHPAVDPKLGKGESVDCSRSDDACDATPLPGFHEAFARLVREHAA